tara:strand:- start:120311 stop:121801 length:1491 start_codon:yes stop_codon:yes gene_type:complete
MQKNKKTLKTTVVAAFTLTISLNLVACNKFNSNSNPVSSEMGSIVCPQSYEVTMDFFNQLVSEQENKSTEISEQDFSEAVNTDQTFQGAANSYFKTELYSLYKEFYQDVKYLSAVEKNSNLPELISFLKVEDTDSEARKNMVTKYKTKVNEISTNMKSMGYSCPSDENNNQGSGGGEPKPVPGSNPTDREVVTSDLIASMRKVLAVTYQSCQVLEKKPLDKTDKNVQGITEECCHEGGGLIRHIASLSQVQATHPYLQTSYGSQCVDIRKKPLIYDFGGRPAFTRGSTGKLNFFTNYGGSEVLGYDCSAMVYTVVMGAGFRLKENKMFVASDVVAAQSRQFLDPESKGWNCLDSVDFAAETEEPMLAGDIASMDGHTFMIYRAGKDPYGIENLTDCKMVDSQNFDFDLMQSSPSKDGVGINVYVGKDYLLTNSTMEKGFVEYAKNYCERKKNGSTKKIKLSYFSLVRLSTKSSCRMPAVSMANESCVQECIKTSTN